VTGEARGDNWAIVAGSVMAMVTAYVAATVVATETAKQCRGDDGDDGNL